MINLETIKNFSLKFWHWPVLLALAAGFFVATSSFNYHLQKDDFVKWISPDETANYTFAKLYAQEGALQIFEKYNLYVQDIIHPRSFRSDVGQLKPVSFIGLPIIFGSIGSLLGYKVLPFLTPFFGGVGLIFFYLLVQKIFGRRNALFSVFLLASFPVYAYYSARSMFHNVLFISLFLAGLYFLILMGERQKTDKTQKFDWRGFVYAMFSGIFIGLTVITRASELLWLAPMLLILWIFNLRNVGSFRLIILILFFLFTLLPVFYWNQILYGAPTNGGYPEMNQSISNLKEISSDMARATFLEKATPYKELLKKLKNNIFFFGFHPRDAWKTFNSYFVKMFPWLFWPALVGLVSFLFSWPRLKKKHYLFIGIYFLVSIILILYYGSWKFNDNPDASLTTIGNSYTRYWLPVYLGAMPFFSFLVLKLTDFKKKNEILVMRKWTQNIRTIIVFLGRAAIIALVFFISINFVMRGSIEGLERTYQKQKEAKHDLDRVLSLTEKNSVIITRYHDKLFFPERKVIIGLFNDQIMLNLYAKLATLIPVYYYNFTLPQKDFDYLNSKKLAETGLSIREVEKVTGEFSLYKLDLLPTKEAEKDMSVK